MLKALELFGFKSFADKTRFEFPAGITVVVGPNGSGKSNIVDAIKWVLGEQSAKSLRGKEMADVIFKGTGTGGRKMMNTAEATIIFDNAERRLPFDGAEVHVTRRVYRSGEGEYLINGQPCRLKDIKEMFRGTGVGADAYSLIEQGKVDQLLQASPKDRRAIFEEAAGISRFKAKKIEAQRRLERVDQNLLRLSDIVDEVENRLKNVRAQASKAKRYREYTERLQQLRTHVALNDWRSWTAKLDRVESQCVERRDAVASLHAAGESLDATGVEVETEIASLAECLSRAEGKMARNRERLATRLSLCEMESARHRELEVESELHRTQLAAASGRAGDLEIHAREVASQVDVAAETYRQIEENYRSQERALAELTTVWQAQRAELDAIRARHIDRVKEANLLGHQAGRLLSQLAAIDAAERKAAVELRQAQVALEQCKLDLGHLVDQEGILQGNVHDRHRALDEAQQELAQSRRLLARRQEDAAELLGRRHGAARRAEILAELEHRREGVLPGVRQLLEARGRLAHGGEGQPVSDGPFEEVEGMVADLFRAEIAFAPLVDAALGESSQFVVVRGTDLLRRLAKGELTLEGRVHLLSLDRLPHRFEFRRVQWEGRRGVLGRADQLVQFEPRFAALAEYLLGRTYFVENLNQAFEFHRMAPGRARFVTQAGEVVHRDGVVSVGPPQVSTSLVSRRSELESLRAEIGTLDKKIESSQMEIRRYAENIQRHEQMLARLTDEHRIAHEALADHRVHRRSLEQRESHFTEQEQRLARDVESLTAEQESVSIQVATLQLEQTASEREITRLEQQLADGQREWERIDHSRLEKSQEFTRSRVELATSEQRLASLRAHQSQLDETRRERSRAITEARLNDARCQDRMLACDRAVLDATSELALLYLEHESVQHEISELGLARQRSLAHRQAIAEDLVQLRKRARRGEEQLHQLEIEAEQVRQQRAALADRIRDDYGIEIADLEGETASDVPSEERQRIEDEINALRRKISNIGAVNMEALHELDDLETRYATLAGQYQDLVQAKESLDRIIQKINADSRRLFIETLEAIRANFQAIYRKAFGGGKADIVLEEGADVLECGIDILATPPGKPTFNNSLLSGGEKALTAVALLLAIFEFRPSPFCVLDEVDAPFDEANIGRFIDVLREFLGWTKFVIVTHSKKTMTAATTLYGVTMQESGVSKRVAVRFEDVSDTGEISVEATRRDASSASADRVA